MEYLYVQRPPKPSTLSINGTAPLLAHSLLMFRLAWSVTHAHKSIQRTRHSLLMGLEAFPSENPSPWHDWETRFIKHRRGERFNADRMLTFMLSYSRWSPRAMGVNSSDSNWTACAPLWWFTVFHSLLLSNYHMIMEHKMYNVLALWHLPSTWMFWDAFLCPKFMQLAIVFSANIGLSWNYMNALPVKVNLAH